MVHRLGRHHVDLAEATARADRRCAVLVACGVSPQRAAEQAARAAVSASLVRSARGGSDAARAHLVEIWLDPVHRWCRVGAGPDVCRDDAAHDALIRMLDRLPAPGPGGARAVAVGPRADRARRLTRKFPAELIGLLPTMRARLRSWWPGRRAASVEQEVHAASGPPRSGGCCPACRSTIARC